MNEPTKPKKPRAKKAQGHHMNDEWVDMHETKESPLFWVDLSEGSQIAALQEKLKELEKRTITVLEKPQRLLSQLRQKFWT